MAHCLRTVSLYEGPRNNVDALKIVRRDCLWIKLHKLTSEDYRYNDFTIRDYEVHFRQIKKS